MRKVGAQLKLIPSLKEKASRKEPAIDPLTSVDLFCGAGGITEGFRQAGFACLYGNDCMEEAVQTFSYNHPQGWSDPRDIAEVDPVAEIGRAHV